MILTSDECKMHRICNVSVFSQCMWRLVLVLCYTLRLFTTYLMNLFLIFLLLLSNYSKVYLWRQSTSGRSASVNQELQGMSSKFQLYKLFLILNVCVVFQSDNEKLVHFFRLPSCKCDICCLEKVNLESVKATNTKPRRERDPCRIVKKMGKMTWRGVLSPDFMSSRTRQQHLETVTNFSQIAKIWSNLAYIAWVTLDLP